MPEVKFEIDQDFARKQILLELERHKKPEQKIIKESTGIDQGYINNMLQKGESKQAISLPAVILFAKALKRPVEYFLYPKSVFLDVLKDQFINIPYIENNPGENGDLILSEKYHMCLMRYEIISKITDNPFDVVFFRIDSDVMENTFSKGDELLIDRSRKQIKDGLIYAYNSFNFRCIRIRRFSVQIDSLKLIADNKIKYDPCTANMKDINIIGQVVVAKHFL